MSSLTEMVSEEVSKMVNVMLAARAGRVKHTAKAVPKTILNLTVSIRIFLLFEIRLQV